MERQTKITEIHFSLRKGEWRGTMSLFSTIEDIENFSAVINLPVEDPNPTPEKVKEEFFKKLVKTFEEINSQFKNGAVTFEL